MYVITCDVCGHDVRVSRRRYSDLKRHDLSTRCGQCRRFVMPATARKSQLTIEPVDPSLALADCGIKRVPRPVPLESLRLARCAERSYGDGGAGDERKV